MNYVPGTEHKLVTDTVVYNCIECGTAYDTVFLVHDNYVVGICQDCYKNINAADYTDLDYASAERAWNASESKEYRRKRRMEIEFGVRKGRPTKERADRYLILQQWADKLIRELAMQGWKDTRIRTHLIKRHGVTWSRERIRNIMIKVAYDAEEDMLVTPLGIPIPAGYTKLQQRIDWFTKLYNDADTEDAREHFHQEQQKAVNKLRQKEGKCHGHYC
jgi:hypothetical protein